MSPWRRRRDPIGEGFVPVRGGRVHAVEIDGEAVLLDEDIGRLHLLNATGALLWACFDGESSIGEIVTDLTDELGAPRDVVLADTLAISRHLSEEGLLANVEPSRPPGEAGEAGGPAGAEAEPPDPRFVPERPDSDSTSRSASVRRGPSPIALASG